MTRSQIHHNCQILIQLNHFFNLDLIIKYFLIVNSFYVKTFTMNKNFQKKLLTTFFCFSIQLFYLPCSYSQFMGTSPLTYTGPRTVMVHLFEWKWTDIEKECETYLGPHGFSAIQVSPPNEHALVEGQPWYQRYQPVSYKLNSRSGSREEFIHMVKACKNAGVDIYVDAVINHMTGILPEGEFRQGSSGSKFGHFSYPDFSYDDFHHCGRNGDDQIHNYNDRYEVQNCALVGLADLNIEKDYVRDRIATYLNDLIDIGVSGFRIDAAKHMSTQALNEILKRVKGQHYIYQEVIDQGGEPIQAQEYFQNGDVTEFKFSVDLSRVIQQGQLSWLNDKAQFGVGWSYLPSDKAIVFVDNHDNQRGHGGGGHILNYKNGRDYEIASALMLAWPYGYPQIMSSFAFNNPNSSPPAFENGQTKSVNCLSREDSPQAIDGWVCEHRWPMIREMVKFRNVTSSQFYISNWWTNGYNQIAFSRGQLGFIVINHEDQNLNQKLQTGLRAGRYCNVLSPNCEQVIEVNQEGFAQINLNGQNALAIHVESRL